MARFALSGFGTVNDKDLNAGLRAEHLSDASTSMRKWFKRVSPDRDTLLAVRWMRPIAHRLSDPRHKQPKTYWVQVEGAPRPEQLDRLRSGVVLNDGPTLPAQAEVMSAPDLWPRDPPVRFRKTVPDAWLALTITEGRNRQVRRMTAAVGLPTLRLVRAAVGPHRIQGLAPGTWRQLD